MKAEKFSDALTNIDEKYVDEAIQYKGIKKRYVWQKWAAIAACLCIALGIAIGIITDTTKMPYELIERDGSYFIQFHDTAPSNSNSNTGLVAVPCLEFSSLRELISDFKTGNFTEEELKELRRFKKNADGEIQICSLNNLYEPILPEGKYDKVQYKGGVPNFIFEDVFVFITLDKARFERELESSNSLDYCTLIGTDTERNANIYASVFADDLFICKYTIESNGYTYYVTEALDSLEADLASLEIIAEKDDLYFLVNNIVETPRRTIEWITQLGIREYVETETQ